MIKNQLKNIGIILSYLILFLLFFVFKINWTCPIKHLLHINCPGCGLTRSIRALLKLNIIESLKYNILGIPIVIFVILSTILILRDIIKNENKTLNRIGLFIKKYYIFLILIVVIVGIVNNI